MREDALDWPISVYARIAVESTFWCIFSLCVLWILFTISTGQDIAPLGAIVFITGLFIFWMVGYLPTHSSIAVSRLFSIAIICPGFYLTVA